MQDHKVLPLRHGGESISRRSVEHEKGRNVLAASLSYRAADTVGSLERGNKRYPNVASQNPADATWLIERKVVSVGYEKINVT